ncbi:lipid-binding SYLF domain-containing protein [Zobellia uliginosa]|uniref:lipid-binding SYLF domain-containing protein n=1 Tax=Zobellia uliginosa TaxID=143224 RepID=UPI0026E351FF|nr:lipid-binding SYLF domain-containing protein [Zobellia uliginosa]MDO6518721.1 lipid-binding SYLF domain-containing protein [Zobellia uliginosa]
MKMKKSILTMALVCISFVSFAQDKDDQRVIADAEKAKIKLQSGNYGLDQFFKNASGYVVFPNVGEGGLIIGGASGNGVLYEKGKAVGMADLKKLDVGLQAGGQALTEVIFFETADALNEFKRGEYELSAQATAVALKKGVAANANYDDGVVVFAKPKKGLMADLSVGGQKFEYTDMELLDKD